MARVSPSSPAVAVGRYDEPSSLQGRQPRSEDDGSGGESSCRAGPQRPRMEPVPPGTASVVITVPGGKTGPGSTHQPSWFSDQRVVRLR